MVVLALTSLHFMLQLITILNRCHRFPGFVSALRASREALNAVASVAAWVCAAVSGAVAVAPMNAAVTVLLPPLPVRVAGLDEGLAEASSCAEAEETANGVRTARAQKRRRFKRSEWEDFMSLSLQRTAPRAVRMQARQACCRDTGGEDSSWNEGSRQIAL